MGYRVSYELDGNGVSWRLLLSQGGNARHSLSPMPIDQLDIDTCLGSDEDPSRRDGSMTPPIVQTSLFASATFRDLLDGLEAEHRHHVYTRGQNPTVEAVEQKLALLERGESCKCFASGMAAVSAVLMGLLEAGDHVVFVNQIYGPTLELAAHLTRFGIQYDMVLERDLQMVERALRPETKLIWLESPGTMLFRVLDVPAIAKLAKTHNIVTAMDNTWATPLFQKPLSLGVDLVVHSCSKYIGGHSDVVAGAVIGSSELLQQIFYRAFLLNGGVLAPFDAWLLTRGLRTLPDRMRRHHADALSVAEFLRDHRAVRTVYHPGLGEDRALAERQLSGYSGLLSFDIGREQLSQVSGVIDRLQRFRIGVSWGGVESLVLSPNRGTNRKALDAHGIPPGLIRISVGLEGADVLIADLDRALSVL